MPARSLHSLAVCRIISSSASKKQTGLGGPWFYGTLCRALSRYFLCKQFPYGEAARGIERCARSVDRVRQPVQSAHHLGGWLAGLEMSTEKLL